LFKRLTTKPKKDKGHHKDEGERQQRITMTGKAVLPESSEACTTRAFSY
jgi:hypothetical protein